MEPITKISENKNGINTDENENETIVKEKMAHRLSAEVSNLCLKLSDFQCFFAVS